MADVAERRASLRFRAILSAIALGVFVILIAICYLAYLSGFWLFLFFLLLFNAELVEEVGIFAYHIFTVLLIMAGASLFSLMYHGIKLKDLGDDVKEDAEKEDVIGIHNCESDSHSE
ncbi:MAG: hypothetical protein CVT48_05455 [Thermoplasmata archaeon HGW-Thermoplasmata-1]|nr:MAG: hypothetical protein CVT48_05455 [Thermoplasmata archaeon HGW-Thermoplasmata-1]